MGPVEKRRPVEGVRCPGARVHAQSVAGCPAGVQTGAMEGALWEREDTLMLAEGDPKPRGAASVRAPSSAYLQVTCPLLDCQGPGLGHLRRNRWAQRPPGGSPGPSGGRNGAVQVGPWPGCGAPNWLAPDLTRLQQQQLEARLTASMARPRLGLQATSAPSCVQVQHVHLPWPPWGGAGRGIQHLECEAIRNARRGGTLKDFLLSV